MNRSGVMFRTFALLSLYFVYTSQQAPNTTQRPVSRKDACSFWHNFTREMNEVYKTYSYQNYNCTYDPQKCNGADCTGSIYYKVQGTDLINVSFCFGLRMNHCDHPNISMDIYYADPNNASTAFTDRIHHNDKKEIKSLKMDLAGIGTLEPFLFFHLTKPVPHHVLFGIRLKVRLTSKLFGIESWPSQYQQDIVPKTEIPATPCPAGLNATSPPLANATCVRNPVMIPRTTPITFPIHSSSYHKPCALNAFGSCSGPNEICQQKNKTHGICGCFDGHVMSPTTGTCSGKDAVVPTWNLGPVSTALPAVIPHSQPQTGNKSTSVSKSVLIGGVVGGIIFILIIGVVVVVACKRHRNNRQYIGRLLLDTDDDTDNVI
ncbi:uncharacterized protein LOC127721321 [Mytilus californianus]|uniref:uncharacterized protein LOC127721321 n=1 Tax=Mytilus californianus TaxID=6549 RepID=UPI002247514F|nr:uncharacterized protein LOC127721321 [Mytilus californianus]